MTPLVFAKNRINAPVDPAKRCNGTGVPGAKCAQIRTQAVAIGCITAEEKNTLQKYGAYPSCNALKGTGLGMLDGWCSCGCFAPDTLISTFNRLTGDDQLANAMDITLAKNNFDLYHLAEDANLSRFILERSNVRLTTKGKEFKDLVVIKTNSGKTLRLTQKHPVLTAAGKMVLAKDLTARDVLKSQQGTSVEIESVTFKKYTGDVVNFSTEAEGMNQHVIFAEGLAVGDQYWQASLEDEMNQVFIRI